MSASLFNIICVIGGVLIGLIVAGVIAMVQIIRLEREKAALDAQVRSGAEALESVRASMDNQFQASAQKALSQSNEDF